MDKVVSKYGIGYGEKSGTWNTYDNGKTWSFISDKIQEQASIGTTTVSLSDDGLYCSVKGEATKVLDLGSNLDNVKIRSVNGKFYVITDNIIYGSNDGRIWETETNQQNHHDEGDGMCHPSSLDVCHFYHAIELDFFSVFINEL